jgi:hypothetical protein
MEMLMGSITIGFSEESMKYMPYVFGCMDVILFGVIVYLVIEALHKKHRGKK